MPFKSSFPDVEIPDASLYDYLFGSLTEEDLGRVAVTDGQTTLTYGELKGRIDAFAGGLAARGVQPGDVVAMQVPNHPAFVVAFHGILRAGATATTINSLYTPDEIAKQVKDSGAKQAVTVSLLLPGVVAGAEQAGLAREDVIVLDGAEGHASLVDLVSSGTPAPEVTIDPAEHLAVLPYSSGTTGNAKGVMLTHRNLVANIAQCEPGLPLGDDDGILAVLPFFHIYGMNVIMNVSLRKRAKVVTMPKMDLEAFLQLTQDEKCTVLFIAPPIAVALAKHPMVDKFDLSSVRIVLSGAAPLDEALGNAVRDKFGCKIMQGYGMTELSPVTHLTPYDDDEMSVGSIGLPVPNVECKVVDTDTGEEIAPVEGQRSAPGEMWVRGPMVMKGYLGNEAATSETIDGDGFLHTGDIVEVGERGEVYVVDRLKELIKYKGYQVPPAELEALLLTHPKIADSAVVAHPDEDGGEIPRAFVVPQQGEELTEQEVIEFVEAKVAPHKKVRLVDFIDAIPKSASGKILRKDLRGLPRA